MNSTDDQLLDELSSSYTFEELLKYKCINCQVVICICQQMASFDATHFKLVVVKRIWRFLFPVEDDEDAEEWIGRQSGKLTKQLLKKLAYLCSLPY